MRKRNIKVNVFLNDVEKKMHEVDISNIVNNIFNITDDLSKLKVKLHYLGYFHEEEYLQNQIDNLNDLIKTK